MDNPVVPPEESCERCPVCHCITVYVQERAEWSPRRQRGCAVCGWHAPMEPTRKA